MKDFRQERGECPNIMQLNWTIDSQLSSSSGPRQNYAKRLTRHCMSRKQSKLQDEGTIQSYPYDTDVMTFINPIGPENACIILR